MLSQPCRCGPPTRRAVAKGEELTVAYATDPLMLPAHWGFVCDCGGPCVDRMDEMKAWRQDKEVEW